MRLRAVPRAAARAVRARAHPRAAPERARASLADDLDHQPLVAAPVELGVEDLLPGPEVELSLGDRENGLLVHEQVLQMRVPVVLAATMGAVVAALGQ